MFLRLLLAALLCLLPLTEFSPGFAHAHSGEDEAFVQEENTSGLSPVTVDTLARQSIGLTTKKIELAPMKDYLRATGEVQAAETQAFEVNPPVSGVVQSVSAKQGDFVKKGQLLAVVYSPEVASSLSQLISETTRIKSEMARVKAQYDGDITLQTNQLSLAEAAFNREKDLLKEGISARRTYQEAETAYLSAQVKLATLKKRMEQESTLLQNQLDLTVKTSTGQLVIMGIERAQVARSLASGKVVAELAIHAPVSGYVTFRQVTLGERVDQSRKLFSIVNLNPIWVMVDIFQEQIPQVQNSDQVIIETPSKERLKGSISSVGTIVDATTKTLHVRIIADNKGGVLRPGMFVTAQILVGNASGKCNSSGKSNSSGSAILVPDASVVYYKESPFVFLFHADEGHYEPTAVKIGQRVAGETEILSGVKPGDTIVTSGAEQLRSQSLLVGGGDIGHDREEHDNHKAHEAEETRATDPKVAAFLNFSEGVIFALVSGCVVAGALYMRKRKGKKAADDQGSH